MRLDHLNYVSLACGVGALLLATSFAQAQLKFAVGDKGVTVDGGPMGRFTLSTPVLRVGKAEERPVYTRTSDAEASAQYACGLELAYRVKADQVSIHFAKAPEGARNFKFTMGFPITFNQGGRYAFDAKPLNPLPQERGEQFVEHGSARSFTIVDPSGRGFTLLTPGGYQGLQDMRHWGMQSFGYLYQFDIGKRTEGDINFSLKALAVSEDAGSGAAMAAAPKIRVDRYGQSALVDFVGKVTSDEQLKADAAKQLAEMAAFAPDARLDSYGGLAGSGAEYKLEQTGYFHLAQAGNRHVLVTPDGNLFFQLGMCGIARTDDDTLVKGREDIYQWLPPTTGEFATAWRDNAPKSGIMSFYVVNWIRKFGKPYDFDEWTGQVVTRLRSWGFNSAGAFSRQTAPMNAASFPYVSFLPLGGSGVSMLPDKIGAGMVFDPFAPGVEEALDKKFAAGVAAKASDPLLIGYFLGNEQHFETLPKLIPHYKASQVAAKRRLVQMLQEKYKNIDAFNAAWNPATPFADFEALNESPLFVRTDAGNADILAFYRMYLDSYYSMIHRLFKKYDPNHLLIGSRWTPATANNKDAVQIGSKYLDVVSINYYCMGIEEAFLRKVYDWSGGKPMIFSEWHYCSPERGLQAHREVKDDGERALAYRNYVEQSAALPFVVGTQWFIYTDQAITGRFFEGFHGEGNNTGLVDVTDRPYAQLVEAATITNRRVYDVMMGKEKPFAFDDARFDGKSARSSGKTVQVPTALPGMKLDGTTSNWPTRPAEPIESSRTVIGKADANLRGDYRVCWDQTNLYFHIQVKDPTPMLNTKTGLSLWNSDCVELFIGPKNLTQSGNLIFTDRQFLIGASDPPPIHVVDHADDGEFCQALIVKEVSGDGYVLQAAIPWKILGVEPKSGMEILFDVGIDNSNDGLMRQQQLMWNGSGHNSGDRGSWGRARIPDN